MRKNTNWLLLAAGGAAIAWLIDKQLTAASTTSTIPASDVVVPQDMMAQLIPGVPLLRGSLQGLSMANPALPVTLAAAAPVNANWSHDVRHTSRPFVRTQKDHWNGRIRQRR